MDGLEKKRLVAALGVLQTNLLDNDNDNILVVSAAEALNDNSLACTYRLACTLKTPTADSASVERFVEVTLANYSLDDFKSHFRMSRSAFQVLNC